VSTIIAVLASTVVQEGYYESSAAAVLGLTNKYILSIIALTKADASAGVEHKSISTIGK